MSEEKLIVTNVDTVGMADVGAEGFNGKEREPRNDRTASNGVMPEQVLSEIRVELQRYRDMLAEKERSLMQVSKEREATLQAYRELLLKANPLVPAEMVSGKSVAELNSALERANAMVAGVRAALEKDWQALRVPAGVSVRVEPDISSYSSKEKIRLGLERMRR